MSTNGNTDVVVRLLQRNASSILDALRPYAGQVDSTSLNETLSAVQRLVQVAEEGGDIPARALDSIFVLTNLVRRWALDEDGMLIRNKLMHEPEKTRLTNWVRELEDLFSKLLGALAEREATG
jgi:hypothetical protein